MSNFVNGYSYPIFRIYSSAGVLLDTIELPLTGKDGLREKFNELSIRHEFLNYSRRKSFQGLHIDFTLNYSEFTNKTTSAKIFHLLNYETQGKTIHLQPRADVGARNFEVIGFNDSIELGILKGGQYASGNHGITLNYSTAVKQDYYQVTDPDNVAISIDNLTTISAT